MIIKLITLRNPCTACLITENLIREVFEKVKNHYVSDNSFLFEETELNDFSEISLIEGLEVPVFPAIILDDEQITAGSIIHFRKLIKMIENSVFR